MTIEDSHVTNNTGDGGGGGVFNFGIATIERTTISGNGTSGSPIHHGGGVGNGCCSLTMVNDTVTGNIASGWGGGVYLRAGSAHLRSVTIAGNHSNRYDDLTDPNTGGGIYARSGTSILIANSIVHSNWRFFVADDCKYEAVAPVASVSGDYVVSGAGTCPLFGGIDHLITEDPLLQAWDDNGGFAPDIAVSFNLVGGFSSAST
jgi:hypothetical protein